MLVNYTARRSIIAGHEEGTGYALIEFDDARFDKQNNTVAERSVPISGVYEQSLIAHRHTIIDVELQPLRYDSAPYLLAMEFMDSVDFFESFVMTDTVDGPWYFGYLLSNYRCTRLDKSDEYIFSFQFRGNQV